MTCGKYAYEALDHTNDELYYSIGLWDTLDQAVAAIMSCADDPSRLDDWDSADEGFFRVLIHERQHGFSGAGTVVYKFDWHQEWLTPDDLVWVLVHSPV